VKEEKDSFKIFFDTFNKKRSREQENEIMKTLYVFGDEWKSEIKMKDPTFEFYILEDFFERRKDDEEEKIRKLYFTRRIKGDSGRGLLHRYTLKKRKYIGTTSMNETLSFLCANQALAGPNSFIMDPFVGTGSILISCMHFGSHCIGTDLDYRVLKGKNDVHMWDNIEQYKFPTDLLVDLVRSDVAQLSTWNLRSQLDAIVCDPPYGFFLF
jgi:tRNA (guanine10-N2)-methyltransferase